VYGHYFDYKKEKEKEKKRKKKRKKNRNYTSPSSHTGGIGSVR
jgi:hypothetical protein